jgi:[protein-PII] uridylyltransferase
MAESMGDTAVAGELKETLHRKRQELLSLHRTGALGVQICSALTDLCDRTIVSAWQRALERVPAGERPEVARSLALAAVGGYGRGDLAPFSDIDLLFLLSSRPRAGVKGMVSSLVRDLWDIGMKLSQSVRTPADAVAFARGDIAHRTALTELRFLAGNESLFDELKGRTHRLLSRSPISPFIDSVVRERLKEHRDSVASVSLLEPNVKKSPGGLRDLHLLRWISLPRYDTRDPEMLRASGILGPEDAEIIARASEFLYRIRNELHFSAGSAQDVLTRDEQVRIARWLGFENQGPLLGVERFMQFYYRLTTAFHDVVMRFAEGARRRGALGGILNRVLTFRVGEHFRVNRETIALDPHHGGEVLRNGEVLLDLFDQARRRRVEVAHESLERARAAASICVITPAARERFLQIVANPGGLGGVIRNLHRIGLLGRFIPAFEQARCLMQFNQYHKYTVDEHSIRALEACVEHAGDAGPIGQAYREVRRKDVLHLAVLLHDIGKGHVEDHSEVGKRIALELGILLGLGDRERDQLVFLVHKHLLMAHTAFRRDLEDVKTIVQFVRAVGTIDVLRMLYVLTAADTSAVAPGEFTTWKESLLTQLYLRSSEELAGTAPQAVEKVQAEEIRGMLRAELKDRFDPIWLDRQLATMPLGYLRRHNSATIASHLEIQKGLGPDAVRIESEYGRDTGLTQYTVFTRDSVVPGLFSKIAGVLAAERFQIVDAQIMTRSDGLVVDTFRGLDTDFKAEPPAHRRRELAERIEQVLHGKRSLEAIFSGRSAPPPRPGAQGDHGSTHVVIDNSSSDEYTVVEVFTNDRLGLLYTITKALFEKGLSIASARISTSLDQVVDVFYVTDRGGSKLTDEGRLESIRRGLLEALA